MLSGRTTNVSCRMAIARLKGNLMTPAPYSADLRWRVIWFVMLSRGQLAVRKAVSVGSANTTSTEARTSSENVTSRFCNLSIIESHYA